MNLSLSLKLFLLRFLFVRALPMQYLLNPERFILRSRIMASAGEGTLPSRFNSIIATRLSSSLPSVAKLWNLKSKSMVRRSVFS